MQAQRRARQAAVTIEGEAVVLERHAGSPRPAPPAADEPINDNRPASSGSARPPTQPDLVFPGKVRWPATNDGKAEAMASRIGRIAAIGTTLAGVVAVALIVASRLGGPMPAAEPQFELTETESVLTSHRDGKVLAVEGGIRNVSHQAATPPAVRVVVDGAGGQLSREFRPGRSVLQPGATLFFHSTLALPSATSGAVMAVSLTRAAERKSMSR